MPHKLKLVIVLKLLGQIGNNNIYNITKTIGFTEISQYLAGKLDLQSAINLTSQKTRNYAKRQLTWINNRFASAQEVMPD